MDIDFILLIPFQAHRLFSGAHTSVVIGCVGLAESFSFGTLGILNTVNILLLPPLRLTQLITLYLGNNVSGIRLNVSGFIPHPGRV